MSIILSVLVFVPSAAALEDEWLTEAQMQKIREESDFEPAYCFALIGDTQYSTQFFPKSLSDMYRWIAINKEKYNIQHVFGLGDITNRDTVYEWENARSAISLLDGAVNYSLIRGNHDKKTYSAEQNESYHTQKTGEVVAIGESTGGAGFDSFFEDSIKCTGRFEKDSVINTWQINCGWLILNLDYNPESEVLAWAGEVIKQHPGYKVIITTHAYLDKTGEHLNVGSRIWEQLVSKYENIQLVFCGHINSEQIVTARHIGKNGNTVIEILVDLQDTDESLRGGGFVAMLYFNSDGSEARLELVSTANRTAGLYYNRSNQFTISLK